MIVFEEPNPTEVDVDRANSVAALASESTEAMALRFAQLQHEKQKLDDQLKVIDREKRILEEVLMDRMLSGGVSSIRVGGATIHTREEVWPALVIPEGLDEYTARKRAVETLLELQLDRMVTYNHMSMRGLVKEMMDADGVLPPPLGDYVRGEIRYRLGVRGARDLKP